uniref:Uncharacterized protein n=1 Tax=Rhizophora mucronata TaxID=61149 RepID=A0A2P2LAL8_RHIMU
MHFLNSRWLEETKFDPSLNRNCGCRRSSGCYANTFLPCQVVAFAHLVVACKNEELRSKDECECLAKLS